MNRTWIAAAGTIACLLLASPSRTLAQESLTQDWAVDSSPGSWATSITSGNDGHPVVLGGFCPSDGGDCELRIAKYNKNNGGVMWDVTLDDGDDSFDDPGGISILPNGDPVVAATRCDSSFNNCRMHVLRLSAARGDRIFGAAYGPPGNRGSGTDVAVGPDGNIFAVGGTCVSDTDCSMLIVRIETDTADALWTQTFDAGPGLDQAAGVAVRPDGDIVVTGGVCSEVTLLCDFRTIRFAVADGGIVWNEVANSASDDLPFGEFAYEVAIDPDGNSVASGISCSTASSCNFRTIKRNGVTGGVIWDAIRNSPNYDGGLGTDDAIGGDTNPIVVGQTCNPADYSDCQPVIMKLDAATGATIWEQSGGSAEPVVLVGATAGGDGNPIATGWVTLGDGNTAFRTIKYQLSHATVAGTAVSVSLNGGSLAAGGVTVTFDTVTTAGATSLAGSSTGPPPRGFGFASTDPVYLDIQTTAAGATSIEYCVNYSNIPFTSPEDQLRLLQFESIGGDWLDVTISQDTTAHVLCGESPALALLAIGVPTP